ncbi:MAG: hypothetical protein B6D41_19915 [Chloroflexi bacterium UTCFX4]|jgi:ADP-ribosylglycohydrolase|nr:MAG: hypothetical protein B6D41_19915 [Chloroflexi bacterium UTCFX4]
MFVKANAAQCVGCLLGGAIGDALGAPIEFLTLAQIRERFGERGVTRYVEFADGAGQFTDDTQMTLFTAEGLLRAGNRARQRGIYGARQVIVYQAYLRWLHTQGETCVKPPPQGWGVYDVTRGWLIHQKGLFVRRAPGNTCLGALRSGRAGTIAAPLNQSKGCGGIMRVAPVALMYATEPTRAFEIGCETAALTHGHPSGYLAAGCLASALAFLVQGESLPQAIQATRAILRQWEHHQECLAAIDRALALYETTPPTAESIETLGGAWVGEETLSIAFYCALHFQNDFRQGILAAVNHSGDCDSTGAVTGNILGLIKPAQLPTEWIDRLELANVVREIALDLANGFQGADAEAEAAWMEKYPPY